MARACTVCQHPESFAINERLSLEKASNRSIAKQYGVNHSSVQRHREHIPQLLVQASMAEEVSHAEDLLARLTSIMQRLDAFLDRAEAAQDGPEFRATAAAILRHVELLAKLRGELQEGVVVNLNLHQEWRLIKSTVYRVLEPYPEAKERAAMEFLKLEGGVTNGRQR